MKKVLCGLLTGLMLLSLPATGVFAAPVVAKNVTPLTITSNSIKIYDDQVSNLASEKVYVKNVETEHSGLSSGNGVVNRVLTITKGGTYQLEGAAAKTQIYVDAPSDDVTLILDDLNLSCESAPVLVVNRANSLEIQLAKDSENTLTGGYYETYTDSVGKTISRGGAISAECDVTITGTGKLVLNGKNKGVEAKGDVSLSCNTLTIQTPGTCVETVGNQTAVSINGGNYSLTATKDGCGIQTPGTLTIYGGLVEAVSKGEGNSGLAAQGGITCKRGASVYSVGMAEENWNKMTDQTYLYLAFAETRDGVQVQVKNETDKVVASFRCDIPIRYMVLTNIDMPWEKTYTVYANGQQLQYGGLYSLSQTPASAGNVTDVVEEEVSTTFAPKAHGSYFGNVMNAGRNAIGDYVIVTPEEALGFTDVKESDSYFEAVQYCKENGILMGVSDTAFGVDTTVSRGMAVTALYRLAGEPEVDETKPLLQFSDVSDDAYYSRAAKWAAENKIVYGTTEGTFMPDAAVTREQMALIMYRYATYRGAAVNTSDNVVKNYEGYLSWNGSQKQAIAYCVNYGLMEADESGDFRLSDPVTRAELAEILYAKGK